MFNQILQILKKLKFYNSKILDELFKLFNILEG